jgi:two-component system chemotaxis sensor kinase CheA
MSASLDDIKATFFEECVELLEALEQGLVALQEGKISENTIHSIFRSVHSIKGGAAAFGMSAIVVHAHDFETLLDSLRVGRIETTPELVSVMFRAADRLADIVSAERDEQEIGPDSAELSELLSSYIEKSSTDNMGTLDGLICFGDPEESPVDLFDQEPPTDTPPSPPGELPVDRGIWKIEFEPDEDYLSSGDEPLYLFRALATLGKVTCHPRTECLPALPDMNPISLYLSWTMFLQSNSPDLTQAEIEVVFQNHNDRCKINISYVNGQSLQSLESSLSASSLSSVEAGPIRDRECDGETLLQGERLQQPDQPNLTKAEGTAKFNASSEVPVRKVSTPTTIRVDLDRVDRLVNLVGELVINQSMLVQALTKEEQSVCYSTVSCLDDLQQLTRDLQDSIMAIRAQPVRSLFQRMTRIVREASLAVGKEVRLETFGEDTEIDKTVVERLADPLTHMIRNAIDHGLESSETRTKLGKPSIGSIRLTARQKADRVIVEVSDDGRGIDRKRVLAQAIERGVLPFDAQPEPDEIDRLLFDPGFSTTSHISSLSGRGVGLDVVQSAIRDLAGSISISSREGKGCTLSLSLPLTLAILDGMIVRLGNQRMVVPLSTIIETQTFETATIKTLAPGRCIVAQQDKFVPLFELASSLGFPADYNSPITEDTALLFVKPEGAHPFALLVDGIEAQRQVVIKGLNESVGYVPAVSAATILGDGQVALIIDPSGLKPVNLPFSETLATRVIQ